MSIFKNDNEMSYVGGRKHWTDVIKNTGDGNLLLWKQPEEDFNTSSTLVVMQGEEAIFVSGGKIEEVFKEGSYKLSTSNYPFISRVKNAFSGGVSTFNCVVYFVKTTDSQEIKWGTDTPIQVRDKVWGIIADVRARGAYKIKVCDSKAFLTKLIGNNTLTHSTSDFENFFASKIQENIRSILSAELKQIETELIGLDSYLPIFSSVIAARLNEIVAEYGLSLVHFSLAGLESDATKYEMIDGAQMERIIATKHSESERIMAQQQAYSQADRMAILGENWGKQTVADILSDIANNPNVGSLATAGAGAGVGMVTMGTVATMASQLISPVVQQNSPQNSTVAVEDRFAINTDDADTSNKPQNDFEKLNEYHKMLEANLITQEEYDAVKAKILNQ